jgi:chromate reductase, NAD(P)H dehydrogenase (quinone)
MNGSIKILAISGSLRKSSTNTGLVLACASMANENIQFTMYDGLGSLPHFNPDLDDENAPEPVKELRRQLKEADGVLICTPEYANGVPGVLKNALDWIVSSGEFMYKPTAVISASPSQMGGEKAHASLLLTLTIMTAKIVEGGTLTIPFVTKKVNPEGEVTDPATAQSLRSLLDSLTGTINPN